jgi:hypothetical protein
MFRAKLLLESHCLLLVLAALTGLLADSATAYEPEADPALRIADARATRFQMIKLRKLAADQRVDLASLVQMRYHKEYPEDLSLSQAAELIVSLQLPPVTFSRPRTLNDRYGAYQDRAHNALFWPLVWMFHL